MKQLVVGIGNPILGDDSVGLRVAEKLKDKFDVKKATPTTLIEAISGYDSVVIVDAVCGFGEVGEVFEVEIAENSEISLSHSAGIIEMLSLAKAIYPDRMPKDIRIIAIEIGEIRIGEELSEDVERAVDEAVRIIEKLFSDKA